MRQAGKVLQGGDPESSQLGGGLMKALSLGPLVNTLAGSPVPGFGLARDSRDSAEAGFYSQGLSSGSYLGTGKYFHGRQSLEEGTGSWGWRRLWPVRRLWGKGLDLGLSLDVRK